MRRLLPVLAAIAALLGACTGARVQGIADPGLGSVSDPAVRYGKLENGLTYFIRANAEPRDRAELRLVVNAGSVLEDPDQLGLAHFVEHMAFNGTRSFERQAIVDYLESVGMRFGPDVNAYTSFDETVYTLTVPTDAEGALDTGIQILQEWASGVTFDSLQVEQERGVVIEEWRLSRGAATRIQNLQFPTLAMNSRYAERLPIGTHESLTSFDHAALRRFYRDWYRPDLMAVVAVGHFDPDSVEALVRRRFGSVTMPDTVRDREEYEVPFHRETRLSIAADPELTGTLVSVYLKKPPSSWTRVAHVRRWVVESLATSMLLNRLNEYSQRPDSPLLDVSSYQGRFFRTMALLALTARVPDNQLESGLRTLLVEMETAGHYGFTSTELERERLDLLRGMEQRYGEPEKTFSGTFAAEYVSYFLQGGSILDMSREHELYREILDRVTLGEINEIAREWLGVENRVILVSVPEGGATRPDIDQMVSLVRAVPRQRTTRYQDDRSDAPLLASLPAPGRIVAVTPIPTIDTQIWQLSNGARLVLKATDYREEEILFAARSPGGTSLYPDEDQVAAFTASAVVQSGGLGDLSANDLRKNLAGKVAGVGAEISESYEGLSGAAAPRDLETLFQLVYLKFTAPRVDSTAFLAYRNQALATLLNRPASPDLAFADTLRSVLSQGHPRARPISTQVFENLNLERSFEIYRDRFADASDFTFYLVGSFDPDSIRPLVEQYLASLPGTGRVERPRDLGIRPPRGVVQRTVRRGLEPKATTQLVFTGPFEFQKANVLTIQSLADVLRIRLRETLREDLGGTYGVTVRGSASRDPVPQYQFTIGFSADPERLEEMVQALFEEIERMKAAGPTQPDLAKVVETQFRSRETELRDNSFWATQFLIYGQYGWDLAEIPASSRRSAALDADTLRDAARRYLDTANYVQVTLLPER